MKMWISDHTLCLDVMGRCFVFRPCNSLDGKFKFNGVDLSWFKLNKLSSNSGRSVWSLFCIPYICVGVVKQAKA